MIIGKKTENVKKITSRKSILKSAKSKESASKCRLNISKRKEYDDGPDQKVAPSNNRSGGQGRLRAVIRDFTDRKQMEELLESKERYQTIFEQAADAIVVFDPQTLAIRDFNDEACQRLGYTREEFAGVKVSDFEMIESAEEIKRHSRNVVKGRIDAFETKHRTRGRLRIGHRNSWSGYPAWRQDNDPRHLARHYSAQTG